VKLLSRGIAALSSLSALAVVTLLASSCQSIAGIEDYRLSQCSEFCDLVIENCQGANTVYRSREACMGFCRVLDEGDTNEGDSKNTLACRLDAARKAGALGAEGGECQNAGPGGGTLCGASLGQCENYCELFDKVCPTEIVKQQGEDCVANCRGLHDNGTLDARTAKDYEGGDTLQCRLVHLTSAAAAPATHCSHARITFPDLHCRPTEGVVPEGRMFSTTCEDYCKLVQAACTAEGEHQVYESEAQCIDVCHAFVDRAEPGIVTMEDPKAFADTPASDRKSYTDNEGNTIACRYYHIQNAISIGLSHCAHAGPGGDGHCGEKEQGNCESYCDLVSAVCPTAGDTMPEFATQKSCMKACTDPDDPRFAESASNTTYAMQTHGDVQGAVGGSGYPCRLLAAARAAEARAKPGATENLAQCDASLLLEDAGCAAP
jgi:hypothetical protein